MHRVPVSWFVLLFVVSLVLAACGDSGAPAPSASVGEGSLEGISFMEGGEHMLTPGGVVSLTPQFTISSSDPDPRIAAGLVWSSSDVEGAVVSLEGSTITAVAPGVARVTARSTTFEGVSRTATVVVTQALPSGVELGLDGHGSAGARVAGETVPITPSVEGGGVRLVAKEVETFVRPLERNGDPFPVLPTDVTVRVESDGVLEVTGDGLAPDTLVGLFLGEAFVPLGAARVLEDSTFRREVPVPPGFMPGVTTLFVTGERADPTTVPEDVSGGVSPSIAEEDEATFAVPVQIVDVDEDVVHALDVTPDTLTLASGDSYALRVDVLQTGSPDGALEWVSSDLGVASMDAEGVVTAQSAGVATIRATSRAYPSATDAMTLTVTAMPVDGTQSTLTITPNTLPADGSSTASIEIQLKDANGDTYPLDAIVSFSSVQEGSIGAATHQGNGRYTATYTAGSNPATLAITATVNGTTLATPAQVMLTNASGFYLHPNNTTVLCPDAEVGDTGMIAGVEYTKRARADVDIDGTTVSGLDTLITAGDGSDGWDLLPTTCTSGVTDFSGLLNNTGLASGYNGNLNGFDEPISTWDTSSVNDMAYALAGLESFNQPIGTWDTSSVTNMASMFLDADLFNHSVGDWDTSSVTSMSDMFWQADSFNNGCASGTVDCPLDWDTSSVKDMSAMFFGLPVFNQDIRGWDTRSIRSMSGMFARTDAFNQDIGGWDTSNVTNMSGMFDDAGAFDQEIGRWDTSNVTTMNAMFAEATAFNRDISRWDTHKVNDMDYMFTDATAFNQDLSGWCVEAISVTPTDFDFGANAWNKDRPDWGENTGCI